MMSLRVATPLRSSGADLFEELENGLADVLPCFKGYTVQHNLVSERKLSLSSEQTPFILRCHAMRGQRHFICAGSVIYEMYTERTNNLIMFVNSRA